MKTSVGKNNWVGKIHPTPKVKSQTVSGETQDSQLMGQTGQKDGVQKTLVSSQKSICYNKWEEEACGVSQSSAADDKTQTWLWGKEV